jgi:metallophosphoesterase (TIGR00282 family)
VRILFVGDMVGKPGRRLVREILPGLLAAEEVDFTVVNVENAAGGFGISRDILDEMFRCGADCLTSGNHIWDRREADDILDSEPRLLRPYNYPDAPGSGLRVTKTGRGEPVAVLNLQGRVFMPPIDCPFQAADRALAEAGGRAKVVLVDFHAEATSEKICMGWHLDGRVSALLGTHTHVSTADLTILPRGAAYCTDVGMTGAHDSVIGMEKEGAIQRIRTQRPVRWRVASGDPRMAAVLLEVSGETGRCTRARQLLLGPDGSPWVSPAGGG